MKLSVAIVIGLLVNLPYCTGQTLFKPPRINEPAKQKTEYIPRGEDVNLNCTAEGTGLITYEWKLNGTPVDSSAITVNPDTGHLVVKQFTLREEGDYQCFAKNQLTIRINPVAVSPVIKLVQAKLGTDWDVEVKVTTTAKEGNYTYLQCHNVPESVPKPCFFWYITYTDGAKSQVAEDDRKYIDNDGTLHFIYLEPGDQLASSTKHYTCGIYNKALGVIQFGSPHSLLVNRVNVKPQVKPQYRFSTQQVKFLRTQTAELECVFSGNPVPTVKWYDTRMDEIFTGGRFQLDQKRKNRKLRITNLQETDAGLYTCRGFNSVGSAKSSVMLYVTCPIWTQPLSYQTLPENGDAKFTCKARPADGDSALSAPIWYKNGEKLIAGSPDDNIHLSEKSTVLTVAQIQKPFDIMCFQCSVSNDVGSEFGSACLNVVNPIVMESKPPSLQEIGKGETVDLTVIASTDPALTLKYRWVFKNISYDAIPPPYVNYDETTKRAYINTSGLTQEEYNEIGGVYYRILYHDYETKTVPIQVSLKPPTTPVVQASFRWWVIVIVVVILIVIIIIALIIFCCCRNKDKEDNRVYRTEPNTDYIHPIKGIEGSKLHDVAKINDDKDPDVKKVLKMDPGFDLSGNEADSLSHYEDVSSM